jgi:hypothetical protein
MGTNAIGKKNVIFDDDVTGECYLVREYVVVCNRTIVSDVDSHHEEVA